MVSGVHVLRSVEDAIRERRACVALESTVISHGLPFPHNLQVALRVEEIVRQQGATPVTVGVMAGEVIVGLDRAQIEHLATARGVAKVSKRDLPVVKARRLDGATTVATTAWAAHQVGVQVFATGGIGGVHRTGSHSGSAGGAEYLATDVSADLPELAQTPVLIDLWHNFSHKPYYYAQEPQALTGTRGQFVETLLNDKYVGVYCMTECVDRKQMKLVDYDSIAHVQHGILWKSKDWSYSVFMGHNSDNTYYPMTSPTSF